MNLLKTAFILAALAGSLVIGGAALADGPTGGGEAAGLRVGTFDSRAVAVAFVRSEMFEQDLRRMIEEHKQAKAAGDQEKVKKLEAQGQARQEQAHRRGFGTAPVDEILARIKDKLPSIAKRASVDVIISKWALTYSTPGTRFVDVTDLIIEPFEPDERTKRIIRELCAKPPIPLEEIEKHHDH
jgi:hypothetical protein